MSGNPFDTTSLLSSNASILTTESDSTTAPLTSPPTFAPTVRLQIQPQGFGLFSPAQSTSDLQVVAFGLSSTPPYRCEKPRYISIRPSRASGNCTLVSASDTSQPAIPLSSTTYSRIPGNNLSATIALTVPQTTPSIDIAPEEIKVELKSRWFSRTTTFTYANTKYQWRHAKKKEREAVAKQLGEDVHTLMLLEEVVSDQAGRETEGKLIAWFIEGRRAGRWGRREVF